MRKPVMSVAIAGLIGAMVPWGTVPAGAAAAAIPVHAASVARAGTVNVASLPRVNGPAAAMRVLPLRTRPGNSPAAPASGAPADGIRSPLLSIAAGKQLAAALKDSDNASGLTPPDMAVGADKTHVVQMVNVVGKIWTKSVAGPAFSLSSFFLAGTNFLSDPWVLYDQESQHWFAGIGDFTLGGERIAVSQTGSPTGSWLIYTVQYPGHTGGGCPDQAKGGIDKDVVVLGFNEFTSCTGSFLGAAIEVFSKAQLIAGGTINFVFTSPQPAFFSLVPAQALSNGQTTEFFASNDNNPTSKALHRVTSVGAPPGTVTLTVLPDLTLAHTYPKPPPAKQKGTATTLNSGDQRMQHVVWKGGVGLLMSWTESCTPATDTAARACARVVATNDGVGGPAVTMDSDLSKKGQYYVYPAATLNSSNDVVVAFEVSSGGLFPQLDAAAATVGGAFGTPVVLAKGTAANTTGRFGDYSAVALDPAGTPSNRNVWAAGEIGGPIANDWQTAVREVKVTP